MRFMMLMIPAGYQGAEGQNTNPTFEPPQEAVDKMIAYNEELTRAGVVISMDGLTHPSNGVRVTYKGGEAIATDGPFAESKEVVGGYWVIKTNTRQEAIEWAKKVPVVEEGDVVELRQIFDFEDYPEVLKEAIKGSSLEVGA
jgi:hypothetical protein